MTAPKQATEGLGPQYRMMIVDGGSLATRTLMTAVTARGFDVKVVADSDRVLAHARRSRYDAILINGDLASVDSLWLCLALRIQGCQAVIIVIGKGGTRAASLEALRVGATERIERTTPRGALVDRISAHIAGSRVKAAAILYPIRAELPTSAGVLVMSLIPTLLTVDGRPTGFSRIEERLFARLWASQGTVVAAEELIASAWIGRRVQRATLRVHLYQLRKKLGKFGIVIERIERGYRFSSPRPRHTRASTALSSEPKS